jgi:hypothetical protein
MRLRTLLVTTAIIAVVVTSSASAQTATSKSRARKGSKATTRAPSPYRYLRKPTTRSSLPPAPPIPFRASRRGTASPGSAYAGMIGMDDSDRGDHSGRSVPFYSVVRGKVEAGPRPSAASSGAPSASAKPPENPQKDPFKMPGAH